MSDPRCCSIVSPCGYPSSAWPHGRPWDDGITWFSARTVEPEDLPLSVEYVRDKVLRVANGTFEDTFIEQLIKAATEEAEHWTQRALMPQTWVLRLSGFPWGGIALPRPPLIEIESFAYTNGDGDTVALDVVSPADYRIIPSGHLSKAQLWPLQDASWPTALSHGDSVEITYRAGYEPADVSPASAPIPDLILTGICLMVGELYKLRSLSVHTGHNSAAQLQLDRFWKRVY